MFSNHVFLHFSFNVYYTPPFDFHWRMTNRPYRDSRSFAEVFFCIIIPITFIFLEEPWVIFLFRSPLPRDDCRVRSWRKLSALDWSPLCWNPAKESQSENVIGMHETWSAHLKTKSISDGNSRISHLNPAKRILLSVKPLFYLADTPAHFPFSGSDASVHDTLGAVRLHPSPADWGSYWVLARALFRSNSSLWRRRLRQSSKQLAGSKC